MQPKFMFARRGKANRPGFDIGTIMRRSPVAGDIGLEVEVEGNKFPKHEYQGHSSFHPEYIPKQWVYHKDGSLRGADNAEYVFRKPLKFDEVPKALDDLWDMFSKFGSVLDESNRTSVHVHLNVQRFHLNRLCSFLALYFSVEDILTQWCGEHRVGNLFCLRAVDAPAIISSLKKFLRTESSGCLSSNGLHYAGLNAQAITKLGSVEVRTLRGVSDPGVILDWVSILERIYRLSADFPDPREICDNFSGHGPMEYLFTVLGDKTSLVKDGSGYNNQQIMESLYEGIRLAQDLCYCRDWSEYEPVEVGKDPFKRPKKKVIESIQSSFSDAHADQIAQMIYSENYFPSTSEPQTISHWTTYTVPTSDDGIPY